jgi:hypothetical protein
MNLKSCVLLPVPLPSTISVLNHPVNCTKDSDGGLASSQQLHAPNLSIS